MVSLGGWDFPPKTFTNQAGGIEEQRGIVVFFIAWMVI